MGQFKQMYQTLKTMNNPQQAINKMIANNPRSKEIMDYIGKYNGNYQKAFYDKAREMGVDPQEFMNNFR